MKKLRSMKSDRKLICSTAKLITFSVLTLCLIVACSAASRDTRAVDLLNLSDASIPVNPTMPRAVLTIAPTQSPPTATIQKTSVPTRTQAVATPSEVSVASTTQLPPTATAQDTATATQSVTITTPTDNPTEFASATFTSEPNQSACPLGCTEPPAGCDIKGNINNEGVKIYHVFGQDFYDKTIIDPEKGERWFCTSDEAIANGWRASKR